MLQGDFVAGCWYNELRGRSSGGGEVVIRQTYTLLADESNASDQ